MMTTTRGTALNALVLACSSSAFLLIGYDNGVMGGLVNNAPFLSTFSLTDDDASKIGTVVAIYEVCCSHTDGK